MSRHHDLAAPETTKYLLHSVLPGIFQPAPPASYLPRKPPVFLDPTFFAVLHVRSTDCIDSSASAKIDCPVSVYFLVPRQQILSGINRFWIQLRPSPFRFAVHVLNLAPVWRPAGLRAFAKPSTETSLTIIQFVSRCPLYRFVCQSWDRLPRLFCLYLPRSLARLFGFLLVSAVSLNLALPIFLSSPTRRFRESIRQAFGREARACHQFNYYATTGSIQASYSDPPPLCDTNTTRMCTTANDHDQGGRIQHDSGRPSVHDSNTSQSTALSPINFPFREAV